MRTRLRQSREIERKALEEVVPGAEGFSLIHFGQLALKPATVQGRGFGGDCFKERKGTPGE